MTSHTALIAKLMAAKGPSDELNCEIARALGVSWSWDDDGNYGPYKILPRHCRFLSSLDAALGTARNQREQQEMLFEMAFHLGTSDPGPGENLWKPSDPPLPMFELCRAALLVRLGGE